MPQAALPFNLPFSRAIAWFGNRVDVPSDAYDRLDLWTKKHAWTVAHVTKARVLQDIRDEIRDVMAEGISATSYYASLPDIMERNGWAGTTPWHAENVLRTTTQMAYGVGHREQQLAVRSFFPYLLYDAIHDGRTRKTHRDLDGTVRLQTDAFWIRHYPPWEWQCRCQAHELTDEEAEALGITPGAMVLDGDEPFTFAGPGVGDEYIPDLSSLDPDLRAYVQAALLRFDAKAVRE